MGPLPTLDRTVLPVTLLALVFTVGCTCQEHPVQNGPWPDVPGAQQPAPGTRWLSFEIDDEVRLALVHVPPGIDEASPLVLSLHGAGNDNDEYRELTRFDAVAEREHVIAAYPQGIDLRWDPARDVEFLSAVIDRLENELPVDPERIYLNGYSNGGFMVHAAAGPLCERVAAIGTVASYLPQDASPPDACRMPVLMIHNRGDDVVPYAGATPTARRWARVNGCVPEPVRETQSGGSLEVLRYARCEDGTEVRRLTLDTPYSHYYPQPDTGVFPAEAALRFYARFRRR